MTADDDDDGHGHGFGGMGGFPGGVRMGGMGGGMGGMGMGGGVPIESELRIGSVQFCISDRQTRHCLMRTYCVVWSVRCTPLSIPLATCLPCLFLFLSVCLCSPRDADGRRHGRYDGGHGRRPRRRRTARRRARAVDDI